MFERSAKTVCASSAATCFSTGTDSPVSADSLACKSRHWMRRMSAVTLSPEETTTTSPGTSSVDATCCSFPSRTTETAAVMERESASSAFRALASCRKPTTALTKTTPKMTAASTHSFRKRVVTVAASRMYTSG